MANAIQRKTSIAQQLERTEKEMVRLKARLEELRHSFWDISSGNGKVRRPEAIREFCRQSSEPGKSKKCLRGVPAVRCPRRSCSCFTDWFLARYSESGLRRIDTLTGNRAR